MPALAVGNNNVIPYRSPYERQNFTAYLGMVIFIASWGMMFAALFFVYGGIRSQAVIWPPLDAPPLPLALPTLNGLMVLLGSFYFVLAVRAAKVGQTQKITSSLFMVLALGTVFLTLQAVVWMQLAQAGLLPSSSTYGSVFFGLTWVHAAHVLVGLVALLWLIWRASRGAIHPARFLAVKLWAMYWHFVGAVWLLLYFFVYVL